MLHRLAPAFAALLACTSLSADEVTLTDGSSLTGVVVMESDAGIALDTMIDGTRTTLTIPKTDVQTIVRSELPEGFFDMAQATADGDTNGNGAYLRIPFSGEIGRDVTNAGLRKALTAALRAGISHVVLEIDTQPGFSDPEALRDLVTSLERYSERLNMHALVSDGRGGGAVLALACHTIHLVPGGRIGGVMPEPREDTTAEEFAVILRRAAAQVGELAKRNGTNPLIARAMIDPAQSVAVWRDADGKTQVGPTLPSGVTPEQALFLDNAEDDILVVDSGQIEAAGRASAADAAALGAVLHVDGWADQGDRGAELMAAEARKVIAAAERSATRLQRNTDRLLDRRATLFDDYQHAMTMVAQYDPSGHNYETITAVDSHRRQWRRVGGIGIRVDDDDRPSTYDTNRFTRESRDRRQRDIDITVGFLDQAIQAVTSMASLEKRAERSGVARAYIAEDLERVEQELRVRRQALAETRSDRGR